MALGEETDFVLLIVGNVAAIAVGLVLELFFFSVDYARSERLQYEDDEYYYYVKAVPKLSVATPDHRCGSGPQEEPEAGREEERADA